MNLDKIFTKYINDAEKNDWDYSFNRAWEFCKLNGLDQDLAALNYVLKATKAASKFGYISQYDLKAFLAEYNSK